MPDLQSVEEVLAGHRLPTLPAIAADVLEMTSGEDIDVQQIAKTVQLDQALAAKVLRTVNSSYYGLSRPCGTVQQAMVFLGLNTVKTLVLSFSLVDTIDAHGRDRLGFDFLGYWQRSVHTAVAARELAKTLQRWDPEEAFFAALMQDFGMIAMYHRFGRAYVEAVEAVRGDHHELARLERDLFDLTHAEIGATVASQWKLPETQVAAIRWHHDAESADPPWRDCARIVELAGRLVAVLQTPVTTAVTHTYRRFAREWFNLDPRATEKALAATADTTQEVASLFKIKTGSRLDSERLLARAESQLFQHQIDMGRQTHALQQQRDNLAEQVNRDGLTGLLDRAGFDAQLTRLFHETQQSGRCLSVLFCDADRFKPINDRYGHAVGDSVLQHLANILQERARREDIVCRFGGDEFVLLLPGCGESDARRVAEDILTCLAASPLRFSSESNHGVASDMTVSSSMGLATFDPEHDESICSPEMLVTCADQAMYIAKRRGGNGVATWRVAA